MNTNKNIIFTGGGTGGHVFPGLALIPNLLNIMDLKKDDMSRTFTWMGSIAGPERHFVEQYGIPFQPVKTGKLRRYLSIKNVTDVFNLCIGFFQARAFLKREKRDVIISIGGFASVTTVLAGASLNIPIINISCDLSLGLAAKITLPFSSFMLVSYPETAEICLNNKKYQKIFRIMTRKRKKSFATLFDNTRASDISIVPTDIQSWIRCVGNPIREEAYSGNADIVNKKYDITKKNTVILFLGGSNGAAQINDIITDILPSFSKDMCIIHQTGMKAHKEQDEISESKTDSKHEIACKYLAFDFLTEDYAHFLARADIVIARAGAGTIWEIVANEIPSLLIPLSKESSRGDQIENARYFEEKNMLINLGDSPSSRVVRKEIQDLLENKEKQELLQKNCARFHAKQSSKKIVEYISVFL